MMSENLHIVTEVIYKPQERNIFYKWCGVKHLPAKYMKIVLILPSYLGSLKGWYE